MGRRARYAQFSHAKQAAPPARPHFLGARKAPAWISLPSRVPRLVCHQTGRPLGERNSTSHVDAAPNVPSMAKRAGTGFSGGGGNPRAGQRGRLAEKDSQGSARMRPPRCLISPLGDGKQVSSRSRAGVQREEMCLPRFSGRWRSLPRTFGVLGERSSGRCAVPSFVEWLLSAVRTYARERAQPEVR